MAPKPKISQKQWQWVMERILAGDKIRPIARALGVSDTAIRKGVGSKCTIVKSTAESIVAAEQKLNSLPASLQVQTINYASELRVMQNNMLSAGRASSATSAKLASVAENISATLEYSKNHTQDEQEEQINILKSIAAYQGTANLANIIPNQLVNIGKEQGDKGNRRPLEDLSQSELISRIREIENRGGR